MVKMEDTRVFTEAYVSVRGGTRLVDRRPEFSRDAKFLVCCSGTNLKVLSVASGECVHVLHGHTKQVTGVKLNPQNPYQILSCSVDKSIIKWDYADGILVKRYKMNAAIHALYTTSVTDDAYLYAVCMKSDISSLVRFRLPHHNEPITDISTVIYDIDPVENHTSLSDKGQFAASVDKKKLIVCDTNTLDTTVHKLDIPKYNTELPVRFTCVACHPSENCVASGINDGRIVLWYNILKKKAVTSIMHWHFVSLCDLAFTREGSYLLSGGSECVLVKWQWNTNEKDFLPRLKSPIVFISCSHDNTHYALCHKDNGIQVVTSNFHLLHLYQGLTQASLELDTDFGIIAGLHQDPRSKALVTNGKHGYLQFYDIFNDKLKFNMDVVSQNFPTPENLMHPHTVTKIECVAFDSTGDWLATVERWDDGQMTPEIRLKFWVYISEKHNYKLNTMVEMPHKQKVHVVKFRPISHNCEDSVAMAITASSDRTFKTWCLVDDTDIYRKNQCWACESVGFFREQIPGALAISEDGTLLAVAFDTCVTLWDPDTNELRATLTPHHCEKHIIHLLFGLESCSHYIIGASSECLYIWNVLSLTVCWSIMVHVSVLVQCPHSDIFAVFTDKRQIYVYTPRSRKPLWASSKPISKSDIKAAIFITSSSSSSSSSERSHQHRDEGNLLPWQQVAELFFINTNHEVLTLDNQKREPQTPSASVLTQNLPQTPFSVILSGKAKVGRITQETKLSEDGRHDSARHFLKEILSTPAHVLPPVSSLAMNLMSTLLIPNKSSEKEDPDDDDDKINNDKHQQNGINSKNGIASGDDDDDEDENKDKDLPKQNLSTEAQSAASQEADEERTFAEERHKEYLKFTGNTDPNQLFDWLC